MAVQCSFDVLYDAPWLDMYIRLLNQKYSYLYNLLNSFLSGTHPVYVSVAVVDRLPQ